MGGGVGGFEQGIEETGFGFDGAVVGGTVGNPLDETDLSVRVLRGQC